MPAGSRCGRTGCPLSADEKRSERDRRRDDRLYRKPTWKSAARESGPGRIVFAIQLVVYHKKSNALVAAAFTSVDSRAALHGLRHGMETFLWR